MPKKEPKLFFEEVKYVLEEIAYSSLNQLNADNEVKIQTFDSYEIENITLKEIVIKVRRIIEFDPKGIFNLKVVSKMILPLNQNDLKFEGTQEDLILYTNSHIVTIINNSNLMETMSLIISQVTSSYGRIPLVTAPFYSDKKK